MKRLLGVVCMVLAFMAVSMMSGCASQKPIDSKGFFVTGSEGAAKQALNLGESRDGGFFVGGGEGVAKKGKQAPFVEKLESIPALQLTKRQLEFLRSEDRPKIEQIVRKTKHGFTQLVKALDPTKYPQARGVYPAFDEAGDNVSLLVVGERRGEPLKYQCHLECL